MQTFTDAKDRSDVAAVNAHSVQMTLDATSVNQLILGASTGGAKVWCRRPGATLAAPGALTSTCGSCIHGLSGENLGVLG